MLFLEGAGAIVDRNVDQMVVVLALTGLNPKELVVFQVSFSVAVELIGAFNGLSSVMQLELACEVEVAAPIMVLLDPFVGIA